MVNYNHSAMMKVWCSCRGRSWLIQVYIDGGFVYSLISDLVTAPATVRVFQRGRAVVVIGHVKVGVKLFLDYDPLLIISSIVSMRA